MPKIEILSDFDFFERPIKFAITGGTDAYAMARGEVTERKPTEEDRLLEIEV